MLENSKKTMNKTRLANVCSLQNSFSISFHSQSYLFYSRCRNRISDGMLSVSLKRKWNGVFHPISHIKSIRHFLSLQPMGWIHFSILVLYKRVARNGITWRQPGTPQLSKRDLLDIFIILLANRETFLAARGCFITFACVISGI